MEWTKEQKRIIDLRDSNILVSAAAGSGKTAVLVARIMDLIINDKENIDDFLIVTFTNAAAGNMKFKIQKELIKALQACEGDIKHLRKQISNLSKAHISTLHSFCLDVVRKNFHIIGVDPNFRIGDTNELKILEKEAIDEVLEKAYTNETDEFKILVESFTKKSGDSDLCDIIKDLYYFILSFPDPIIWLEGSVDSLNVTEEKLSDSSWIKVFKDEATMLLNIAEDDLNKALELYDNDEHFSKLIDVLNEDRDSLNNLMNYLNLDFNKFVSLLNDYEFPAFRGTKKGYDKDIHEEAKVLRDEYKEIINYIAKIIPSKKLSEYAQDLKYMYEPMKALKDIISDLDNTYKSKKIEKGILDFNDIEHFALKILRNEILSEDGKIINYEPSEIGRDYNKKFSYIFIDEYQDSNRVQEALIEQIKRSNNLFMVGDVKQSIYAFRQAEPGIFNEKYNSYEKDSENLEKKVFSRRIDLNKNFRSRKEVLEGTNTIFKNIMSKELGEINYNEDQYLYCGAGEFKLKSPIELNIIDNTSDGKDFDDDELLAMKTVELEASFIAQRIKELVKEETSTAEEKRKIEYSDIVILMRAISNKASIIEEVFNKENIPFYFDGGSGYFDTIEIQIILSLLNVLNNTRQDVPLLSVMRSPIGNFTIDELIKIRYGKKGSYISSIYKYLDDGEDEELKNKIKLFMDKIYDWRERSQYTHLDDLIWEILMESNYYYFVGVLPNGKMRQANLRLLTDKAYDFEKTSMRGLYNFLRYVEKLNLSSGDEKTAKTLGENDNVVRLMTVHKSKGLEFPVVIMCGISNPISEKDEKKDIIRHKDLGIAPKYVNKDSRVYRDTLPRMAIKNKIKIEAMSEEMRILYVAMTRAVDKLIFVGTFSHSKWKFDTFIKKWPRPISNYLILTRNNYLDWIGGCLFSGKNSTEIIDMFEGKMSQDEVWKFNRIKVADLQPASDDDMEVLIDKQVKIKEISEFKESLSNNYDEINRRLSYKYSYENSVDMPTKLSVTDLKMIKGGNNLKSLMFKTALRGMPEYDDETNEFLIDKKEYTGAEIGTLVHFVMQHLNIRGDLSKNGILEQIKNMIDKKLLTEQEANIVSRYNDKIFKYFDSEIGKRMVNSNYIKREVPFLLKKKAKVINEFNESDDILIQGIIDCFFIENDEVVIIDYKTDSASINNIDEIKEEYKEQISSYKEAVEKITKKTVKECYLYLFALNESVLIDTLEKQAYNF